MSDVFSAEKRKPADKQGWGSLANSPKWHYFVEGRSLCGKWLGLGITNFDDDPLTDDSPDNCAGCKKKVPKLRTTEAMTKREAVKE